jgi:glyoxylase-like metal-dependent hydrolase (beta-lactamase superfamily II)
MRGVVLWDASWADEAVGQLRPRVSVSAMIDLPVADPWWVRERAGEGITLLTEPHVHPLLRCNVWHVEGRTTDLVIDTSLGLAPLRHLVERETASGLLAIATHSHSDHIGGLGEFVDRAAHGAEAAVMGRPVVTCLDTSYYDDTVLGPYRDAGYEIPALFVDAVPPGGIEAAITKAEPVPPTRLLDEGEIVDLGDRSFEVLHLPGHSPGSIGLWERTTGILFSGDAVYDGPLLDELDGSDIEAYLLTMQRLRDLPVTVVHGGHEPSFGRDRLVEICDSYLAAH